MGITIYQCKYILNLLKETGMLSCKPLDTPMDCTIKLGTVKMLGCKPLDTLHY